jgi:Xaa-Pro aminopeptidase
MVIANEPAIKFPDENLGVRIEDSILITEDGCEHLTKGLQQTVQEIEKMMIKDGVVQVLKKAGLY